MADNKEIKSYFRNTDSYLTVNPVIELRRKIVHDLIGDPADMQILDIGCGDGTLTIDYVTDNKLTFLDITFEMLDIVRKRIPEKDMLNVKFENRDIADFNPERKYDIIICMGVFAHVGDIISLILKIEDLLNPGGIAVIQFTDCKAFISWINRLKNNILSRNQYGYPINLHSTKAINKIIRSSGLTVLKRVSYWPVSPLFSLLSYENKRRAIFYFYNKKLLAISGPEKVLLLKKLL